MIIGIDASRVVKKFKTGTEYYSIDIINQFIKLDQKNKFILYTPANVRDDLERLPKNFCQKIMPFPRLWSQLRLSFEMIVQPPDVLFVPSHTVPIWHPKNTVVTVHDLGFEHFPELYTRKELIYHRFTMRFSVKHAKNIIAISQATKNDIVNLYGADPRKITVIHHGVDANIYRPPKNKKLSKTYKKYGPYICSIGRLEKKKNTLGIVRAFAILRQNPKIRHKLILVGKPGYGYREIAAAIQGLPDNIRRDVIETGYVHDREMINLMQAADIFLFPSFFEGFGLPILQAMSAGIPVITSNISSMPEVAGDAGIIVNPHQPHKIAQATQKLVLSRSYYNKIRDRGLKHARKFKWRETGKKTLEVIYEDCACS